MQHAQRRGAPIGLEARRCSHALMEGARRPMVISHVDLLSFVFWFWRNPMRYIFMPPRLVRRNCGGWLALSSRAETLQIGVTAASRDEAKTKFEQVMSDWRQNLSNEDNVHAHAPRG